MIQLRVSKEGREGVYGTIGEALAQIPEASGEQVTISIEPGIYEEIVEIRCCGLTLRGTGKPEDTVIQYGNYANMEMEDGSRRGTFRSYVLFLDGDNNTLENLTIRNTAYPRKKVAQALALYADGDGITVRNCRLESYQDTLFTGPLPPTPMSPGGFAGPKEWDERRMGRQRYDKCVISGDVDFIFGSAMVLFTECELVSRNGFTDADQAPEKSIRGYVTAASTPEGCPVGYVFVNCRFTSRECPPESVYLGRPWRDYAKTVMICCELGAHIHSQGFHDWKKTQAHGKFLFGEYGNYGPGSDTAGRAEFVRKLNAAEALKCLENFRDRWDDVYIYMQQLL